MYKSCAGLLLSLLIFSSHQANANPQARTDLERDFPATRDQLRFIEKQEAAAHEARPEKAWLIYQDLVVRFGSRTEDEIPLRERFWSAMQGLLEKSTFSPIPTSPVTETWKQKLFSDAAPLTNQQLDEIENEATGYFPAETGVEGYFLLARYSLETDRRPLRALDLLHRVEVFGDKENQIHAKANLALWAKKFGGDEAFDARLADVANSDEGQAWLRTPEGDASLRALKSAPLFPVTNRIRDEQRGELEERVGMKFVNIPAGTFKMGSPRDEKSREGDETQHEVTLTHPFSMGVYSVTGDQWRRLLREPTAPGRFQDPYVPMNSVSWWSAIAFANEMSSQAGLHSCYAIDLAKCTIQIDKKFIPASTIGMPRRHFWNGTLNCKEEALSIESKCEGYRLPTEAEWEYAARAGTQTPFYFADSNDVARHVWFHDNSRVGEDAAPHSVYEGGAGHLNAWGLSDMLGNMLQWTNDWHGDDFGIKDLHANAVDPTGPSSGKIRVARGGYSLSKPEEARCAWRTGTEPKERLNIIGFRLVRTLD